MQYINFDSKSKKNNHLDTFEKQYFTYFNRYVYCILLVIGFTV